MNASTRSARAVTDILIIGEPIVGGTLVGSYRVRSGDGELPAQALHAWYVDGAPAQETQHFQVRPEHIGKRLVFSVTLREPSGLVGQRGLSAQKTVTASFQNISREESEASFLKQHGNFSLYSEEPADRIFVSTGGAFAAIDPKTQKVFVEGENAWGADVPSDMMTLFRNNPATRLFSTEKCFAALVDITPTDNRLLVWGPGILPEQGAFRNVKAVYSNRTVFAFIHENPQGPDHRIGAVAPATDEDNGARIPDSIQLILAYDPPKAIYATENAFAVLTEGGKVHAWGNATNGGSINAFVRQQLDGMTVNRIVATDSAFCATDTNGQLVTWGATDRGGIIPGNILESILDDGGVNTVVANRASFLVVTRRRRKAYSFGRSGQGGDMSAAARDLAALGNIVLCKSSNWAHTICNDNGQFAAWGAAAQGGTSPTSPSDSTTGMDMLFERSGAKTELQAYFQSNPIARRPTERITSTAITTSGSTVDILSTDSSFFLYSRASNGFTEKVVAWGQANAGGALPNGVRQVLESSIIESVHTSNGAYGVTVSRGEVTGAIVVWGVALDRGDAGEIPPVLEAPLRSGVIEIYSIKRWPEREPSSSPVSSSFSARLNNHTYGLWGGNVRNQLYDPGIPDRIIGIHNRINVGQLPIMVVFQPGGLRAYVTNSNSHSVSVIDTRTEKVIHTLDDDLPYAQIMAIHPDGSRLYVGNARSNRFVAVFDTDNYSRIGTLPSGGVPTRIITNASGSRLYVASMQRDALYVYDTATYSLITTVSIPFIVDVVFDKSGTRLYVVDMTTSSTPHRSVTVIDAQTHAVTERFGDAINGAGRIAFSPHFPRAYLSATGGWLYSLNTQNHKVENTLSLGGSIQTIAFHPDREEAYMALNSSNSLCVVDTRWNTITQTLPGFSGPMNVAVSPDGNRAYVANSADNSVLVVALQGTRAMP